MKTSVLEALSSSDSYVSGEQLSELLGVSRTMIWKIINQLKADGYEIESSSRKGYRLVGGRDKLTQEALNIKFKAHSWISRVEFHEVLDSTNLRAKHIALDSEESDVLIVADRQDAGRGRLGRSWVSESGTGLWSSLLLRPDIEPEAAFQFTLIAAVSVATAIEKVTGLDAKIKWPNDIIVNRHKVCGILTEMSAEWQHVNYLVLGIGINVNQASFPDEIAQFASSLAMELGESVNRLALLEAMIETLDYYRVALIHQDRSAELLKVYKEKSATLGQRVKVIGKEEKIGLALDMNDAGALYVEFEDGTKSYVNHGEVSVRGIDFYA